MKKLCPISVMAARGRSQTLALGKFFAVYRRVGMEIKTALYNTWPWNKSPNAIHLIEDVFGYRSKG